LDYLLLKFVHVIGAAVLLGTGTGIAFFMLAAHMSRDVAFIARTASVVVIADYLFTASAVVAQPISGYLLTQVLGIPMETGWIAVSLAFYVVAGVFWLPVVWIQSQLRDLARKAAATGAPLPDRYHKLFRIWFAFGLPGFGAVLAIVWLMVAKPSF
jgi:uncharacterized membrane protein